MADANCTRTEGRNAKYVRAYRARKAAGLPKACSSEPSANDRGRVKKLIHCAGCHAEYWRVIRGSKDAGKYCSRGCYERLRADVSRERESLRRIAANWKRPIMRPRVMAEIDALARIRANWKRGWSPEVRRLRRCVDCSGLFAQRTHWGVPEDRCQSCKPVWSAAVKAAGRKSPAARAAKAKRKAIMRGALRVADRIDPIAVFERDGWRCHICKAKTRKRLRGTWEPKAPELDHIIPLAAGGTHTWDNVACACRRCNGIKSDKPLGQLGLGFAS